MNGQREKAFLKKPVLINQPYCNNSKKKKKNSKMAGCNYAESIQASES